MFFSWLVVGALGAIFLCMGTATAQVVLAPSFGEGSLVRLDMDLSCLDNILPGPDPMEWSVGEGCSGTVPSGAISGSVIASFQAAGERENVTGIAVEVVAGTTLSGSGGNPDSFGAPYVEFRLFHQFTVLSPTPYRAAASVNLDLTSEAGPGASFAPSGRALVAVTNILTREEHIGCFGCPFSVDFVPAEGILETGVYEIEIIVTAFANAPLTFGAVASATANLSLSFGDEDCPQNEPDGDCNVFLTPGVTTGSLADGAIWQGGEAPVDRGDGCQNAFMEGVTGLFTFGSVGYNGLFIRGEESVVTLRGTQLALSGFTPLLCPLQPALGIGSGATLVMDQGTLLASLVIAGDEPGSDLPASLTLRTQQASANLGVLRIGDDAAGKVQLESGATLSSTTTLVGGGPSDTSTSTLVVASGSQMDVNELIVGETGTGSLEVSQGGKLTAREARFATSVNADESFNASVLITDADTLLDVEQLSLGSGGPVQATISNGGRVNTINTTIGAQTTELSEVTIQSVSGAPISELMATGDLIVGGTGPAVVTVNTGGLIKSLNNFVIGQFGAGEVILDTQSLGKQVDAFDFFASEKLTVGNNRLGLLTLKNGSAASVKSLEVGNSQFFSTISLDPDGEGPGSFLEVEQDAVVGRGGIGIVELKAEARMEVGGSLTLGQLVRGNGAVSVDFGDEPNPESASGLVVKGGLILGVAGLGSMFVSNGGYVEAQQLTLGQFAVGKGDLIIFTAQETNPSEVRIDGLVDLGSVGSGRLAMSGQSLLRTGGITVGRRGLLELSTENLVDGVITVQEGGQVNIVTVPFSNKQGSPTPALIDGNLTLEPGAVLRVAVNSDGTPALKVMGSLVLNGILEIEFPPDFEPEAGFLFDLFDVAGSLSGNFEEVRFPGRSNDADGTLGIVNGVLQVTINNPGTPLPGGLDVVLSGTVTNATTGVGVVCAVVELTANDGETRITAVTDANGFYFFEPQEAGVYGVRVMGGIFEATAQAPVELIDGAEAIERNFELTPSSANNTITGFVTDADTGAPLVGVRVVASEFGTDISDTYTCSNGRYFLVAIGSFINLRFSLENYADAFQVEGPINNASLFPLQFSNGSFVGTVRVQTPNGPEPQAAARIILRGPSNTSALTSATGSFGLGELVHGDYSITATVPGFRGESVKRTLGTSLGTANFLLEPLGGLVEPGIPGDINRDGQVNAVDVQLVINAALGIVIGDFNADVNGDGVVNAVDVQLVINAALGIEINF